MKTIIYFTILLLVALICGTSSEVTTTTLIVDPASTSTSVQCGLSAADACPRIIEAYYSFLNSTVAKTNPADSQFPPLVIELVPGDYSKNTYTGNINFYGFDVTIQPYQNQKVVYSGVNTGNSATMFSFSQSGKVLPSLVNIYNITFDKLNCALMNGQMYTPLTVNFENVTISNSQYTSSQLIFFTSYSTNQTVVTFTNTAFDGCSGGLILVQGVYLGFYRSAITNTNGGQPISAYSYATLNITDSLFFKNNVPSANAIIFLNSGNLHLVGTTIQDNNGVAIWGTESVTVTIQTSYILRNTGSNIGAIRVDQSSSLDIQNSTINQNSGNYGGAIYSSASPVTMANCIVYNNLASQGMAIYISGSDLSVTNTSIMYSNDGSSQYTLQNMIYAYNAQVTFTNSSLNLGSQGVVNYFTLIDCTQSTIISYSTNVTTMGHDAMSCSSCTTTNGAENTQDQQVSCPPKSDSSSNGHKNSSSEKKPKKINYAAIFAPIGAVAGVAFIIVIVVIVKRRNRRNYHSI
ncbi:hypothetical protein CYY_002549 [Polysphondylium violaceum]|uniref:Right handed beta helix domain-containing protein n=1 Tax=Polysphondylium violaceum TaxID=133409 RepID=A0A8J4V6S9_9MYCE|nr:hypothetical protein CYY_002549 [Polysphondylium violaceum]